MHMSDEMHKNAMKCRKPPGVPDTSPAARYTTIVASETLELSMRVLDDRAVPSVKSQAWQGDWENHPYYYP